MSKIISVLLVMATLVVPCPGNMCDYLTMYDLSGIGMLIQLSWLNLQLMAYCQRESVIVRSSITFNAMDITSRSGEHGMPCFEATTCNLRKEQLWCSYLECCPYGGRVPKA